MICSKNGIKKFENRWFSLNNPLAAGLFRNQEELDEAKLLRYAKGEVEDAKKWSADNKRSAIVFHDKRKNYITFRPLDVWKKLDDNVKKNHRVLKIVTHNEENSLDETRMPKSILQHKIKSQKMSDTEKKQHFAGKSKEWLKAMAWRHGYGKDSNEYAKHHDGVTESQMDEAGKVHGTGGYWTKDKPPKYIPYKSFEQSGKEEREKRRKHWQTLADLNVAKKTKKKKRRKKLK
jgi:hypothetical protein